MGLQTWPPSHPPLSSMACLDVETSSICRGKFKSVLQLCLQQRRTREQLVEQGIMPPLKTPAAFHGQIRSLERARTGNFLKHKLCSRPGRSELVRMHILQETQTEPSLQATQMKLKKARLADDLNEKIAQRPGAMELVEKNILHSSPLTDTQEADPGDPCSASVLEKPATPDVYKFDEVNGEALSPEQPSSQAAPSSSGSQRETGGTEADSSSSQANMQISAPAGSRITCDLLQLVNTNEQQQDNPQASTHPAAPTVPSISPAPLLVKQSLHRVSGEKSRSKKSKEPKPRMKKLKYHQYIPPDQKQEPSEAPMDSAYARLLQQQQQFLQLQILKQQQRQYSHHGVRPVTLKTEVRSICSREDAASPPVLTCHTQMTCKLDHLPANLDEMKVAELKMELKLRSLPVSGTKTDLIERLKLYLETSNIHSVATMETPQPENLRSTPPVSPIASKVSSLGIEDSSVASSPAKLSDAPSPAHTTPSLSSLQKYLQEFPRRRLYEKDSEKDKRLYEKERQIEELMRKLVQEQRLVEELKMQLEVEKRSQQGESPPQVSPTLPVQVKEETASPSNCFTPCSSGRAGDAVSLKQEEAADRSHLPPSSQCIVSQQTIKQPETLQPVQAGAQLLQPASSPASGIRLHAAHTHTSGLVPPNTEAPAVLQRQSQPLTRTWRMETTTQSRLNTVPAGAASGLKGPPSEQFMSQVLKCKDPPRYEDAVKQTHGALTAAQADTAASQHMDDLFDVLIESGEISPYMRRDASSLDKPLPVTASVTTLPVNTVLSRPPPLVQVAQLPVLPINPSTSLAALASDSQLGTLLDATLGAEPQSLTLMEELHSPLVTMEVDFMEQARPPALTQQGPNMDNMDWLDLTLSEPGEGVMSAPVGVFSSDFLDSNELHLNWD